MPIRPGKRVGGIPVAPEVAPGEDLEVLPVEARPDVDTWTRVGTRRPLEPGEAVHPLHLRHLIMEPRIMGHSVDIGGRPHPADGVLGRGGQAVVPIDRQMSNRRDKKSMIVPTLGMRT